ncbi:cytochrome c oxidase assembly protein [Nocardiopsis alkaliphila]|uniref:cytochrome c oxidase assembly protein n=1 Tax=Nocardiopsis alkaliphila TaxID=225762 RepID=UPI0003453D6B|nr:cytochrome c oxidase assembly protein [Nocardiopsis alkaliphila]
MDHHHEHRAPEPTPFGLGEWSVPALLILLLTAYLVAVLSLRERGTRWPMTRTLAWLGGLLLVGAGLVGPLAERAHHDFVAHMAGHVLLGMLGPLFLVLAAPATLALRVLPVGAARRLSRLLTSPPATFLTNPFIAALLNIGGLWVLYRTGLYTATHTDPLLHAAVHIHVPAAGYLFTFAILGGPDPAPHRLSAPWRAWALVASIAAHNVLAKVLYATPPEGVPAEQARAGAELMYYGGAPVEIALIFLVCRPWLLPSREHAPPRRSLP